MKRKLPALPEADGCLRARDGEVIIEVLQCKGCGRLAVGVAKGSVGKRLTNHKCAGGWSLVFSGRADAAMVIRAVQDHQVIPEGCL